MSERRLSHTHQPEQHQSNPFLNQEILGNEKFKAMTSEIDQQLYGSYKLVTCASCKEIFDFVEGNFHDAPKKDNNGKPLAE